MMSKNVCTGKIVLSVIICCCLQTLESTVVETPVVDSGITEGAVLIVPSPNSFIQTSDNITDDISTDSVLPMGTLTGKNVILS